MKHTKLILSFVFLLSLFATTPALAQQEKVYSKNPKVDALIKEGFALEESGDFPAAIAVNKKILRIMPKNIYALNTIAGLYGRVGKFNEEIKWAKKAIDVNPNFYLGYINYGNGLAALNRYDESEKAFKKAMEIAPKNPLPYYSLGVLSERQKKFKVALDYYQKSIDMDPKYENGYFNLAMMHANFGQFDKAIVTLKKLIAINPKDNEAKSMLKRIENEKKKKP